jgi:hypothetical protein
MSPHHAQAPHLRFPTRGTPDCDAAERRLALLSNWRHGVFATAIVVAGLLPLAIAWRDSYVFAIGPSIVFGASLAISTHIARRRRLQTLAPRPKLVQRSDLVAERRRLQSTCTRRALAAGLRRTADPIQPRRRFDPCPVPVERVAPIRNELLKLANDIAERQVPGPAFLTRIGEIPTYGSSPLYNPNLPAANLYQNLASAGARDSRPIHQLTLGPPAPPRSDDHVCDLDHYFYAGEGV